MPRLVVWHRDQTTMITRGLTVRRQRKRSCVLRPDISTSPASSRLRKVLLSCSSVPLLPSAASCSSCCCCLSSSWHLLLTTSREDVASLAATAHSVSQVSGWLQDEKNSSPSLESRPGSRRGNAARPGSTGLGGGSSAAAGCD